jgi:hypothetical protein
MLILLFSIARPAVVETTTTMKTYSIRCGGGGTIKSLKNLAS